MDIASTLGEFSRESWKKDSKIQPSVVDSITHDIVNHLSIICLCSCELRNSLGEKLESDQLKEFNRIEVAVQDAAEKIQKLKRILQAHQPAGNDRQAKPLSTEQNNEMPSTPWLALSHAD
jgi:hypothetical protein